MVQILFPMSGLFQGTDNVLHPYKILDVNTHPYPNFNDGFVKLMTASSDGNFFPRYCSFVRRIHLSPVASPHKAFDAELWYSIWCAPQQTIEQAVDTPVI